MAEARNDDDIHYETRDVPAAVPVAVAVLTIIFVPLSAALLWLYFVVAEEPPQTSSIFSEISEREASAPPLIPNPAVDVPESIRRMDERLHGTGWVDRDAGIVHMPIDRAMERLVERGLTEGLFPLSSHANSRIRPDQSSDKGTSSGREARQ